MKGATLIRPWDEPIVARAKPIENRTWRPESVVGEHIAIHAGKKYDREAAAFIRSLGFEPVDQAESDASRAGHVVGVARVRGWIKLSKRGRLSHSDTLTRHEANVLEGSPWFAGDGIRDGVGVVGWVLDEAVAFEPVRCRGAQGLWTLPEAVAAEVRRRWEEAKAA